MKNTLIFNTTVGRINWLGTETHDIQSVRIGWKFTTIYTEYGINRVIVDILNIAMVHTDGEETQLDLKEWEILTPVDTSGMLVFGLWPENVQIKSKQILIKFK